MAGAVIPIRFVRKTDAMEDLITQETAEASA